MKRKLLRVAACALLTAAADSTAAPPGAPLWQCQAPPSATLTGDSPVVGPDGTIYCALATGLWAVGPNGSNKWQLSITGGISTPAVGSDGTIYCVSPNGKACAIKPDGSQLCQIDLGLTNQPYAASSPALASDGTIFFSVLSNADPSHNSRTLTACAVNPDGSERWRHTVPREFGFPFDVEKASPVIGADGTVYFGGNGVYAFESSGVEIWEWVLDFGAGDVTSLAIGGDGTLYAEDGASRELYGLDTYYGVLKWQIDGVYSAPVVGPEGTVFVEAASGLLTTISPSTGAQSLLRLFPTVGGAWSTLAVGSDGALYIVEVGRPSSPGLWAFSMSGATEWGTTVNGVGDSPNTDPSPIITPGGVIYFCSGSTLFAVQGYCGAAHSPWAMPQGNSARNGRAWGGPFCPPCLSTVRFSRARGYEFSIAGIPGTNYTIQASTNLPNWTPLLTYQQTNANQIFYDPASLNLPYRFYRAVSP